MSRRALGAWEPADEVRDPVDVVMAVAAPRQARLIPLRTARMAVSPFTFYRGAAQLMADDLGTAAAHGHLRPALRRRASLQLRHVRVARAHAGVRHQRFRRDEPGPWEWDLKRLTTSFVLAARDNGIGAHAEEAVRATVGAYVAALNEMAGLGWLERRYRMVRADRPVVDGVEWTARGTRDS